MESQEELILVALYRRKAELGLGASHVSLMEVERQGNQLTLRPFDCRPPTNSAAARHVAEAISQLVTPNMTIKPSMKGDLFEEASCPQLSVICDSGAYVLCCAEILCRMRFGLYSTEVTSVDHMTVTKFKSNLYQMLKV